MKKLLCIALFSMAIMANAAEKKEIVANNSEDVKVEKSDFSETVKTAKSGFEKITSEEDVDCGEKGDLDYSNARLAGQTHKQARRTRRLSVRKCRGGTWAWLGVCVGFIGHCNK